MMHIMSAYRHVHPEKITKRQDQLNLFLKMIRAYVVLQGI